MLVGIVHANNSSVYLSFQRFYFAHVYQTSSKVLRQYDLYMVYELWSLINTQKTTTQTNKLSTTTLGIKYKYELWPSWTSEHTVLDNKSSI